MVAITTLALNYLLRGDPQGAISFILGRYGNSEKDLNRAYAAIQATRGKYLDMDANRRTEYADQIRNLMQSYPPDSTDFNRLQDLLNMRLFEQHRVYLSKKSYLQDPEGNRILSTISPAAEFMADFRAPPHVWEAHSNHDISRRQARVMAPTEERPKHTEQAVLADIELARQIAQHPVKTIAGYHKCIAAMCLLSGRRHFEIAKTITWAPGPTPLQAIITGIAKSAPNAPPVAIPLLVNYDIFDAAMTAIRAFRTITDSSYGSESNNLCGGVSRAAKKIFTCGLTHTDRRSIYAEMAYRDKENNGFAPGGCHKSYWIKLALGHSVTHDLTPCYMSLDVV